MRRVAVGMINKANEIDCVMHVVVTLLHIVEVSHPVILNHS